MKMLEDLEEVVRLIAKEDADDRLSILCDNEELNNACYWFAKNHHATIRDLAKRLEACEKECREEARLNGMGSEREAALMARLEVAERDAARRHPHCKLSVSRDIAPDDGWHWSVHMPDGHMFAVSHGRMDYEQVIQDATTKGAKMLADADGMWRANKSYAAAMQEAGR